MQVLAHLVRSVLSLVPLFAVTALAALGVAAAELDVFHADSLAGPMREVKRAFEGQRPGVTVRLTSGVSKQLAERIVGGDACDVFAPSSPAVIDEDMMGKPVRGTGKAAASWYVVFSANEMAIITTKGNPLKLARAGDLFRSDVKFVRVTGDKDLATGRTIEFLKRAAASEGAPDLAQKIVDSAQNDPTKVMSVPDVVAAVRLGTANAAVVYYSAAVAARNDVDIIRFPDSVNLSEAIRNAATVPGTARNVAEATALVRFLISPEGQAILKDTGQPPVVPAIRRGTVPEELR